MHLGIISDTHGLLRPEALSRLAGSDHIIHAGDIGSPDIVDQLGRIAPVTAIRGNIDSDGWARRYSEIETVELGGKLIYVLHDLNTLQIDPAGRGIDVVISGHSHAPKIETRGGVLYLNPGSAGRRRFKLPITLATLDVTSMVCIRRFTIWQQADRTRAEARAHEAHSAVRLRFGLRERSHRLESLQLSRPL